MEAFAAFALRLAAAVLIIAIMRAVTHEAWSHRSYARALWAKRKTRTRKARPAGRPPLPFHKVQP